MTNLGNIVIGGGSGFVGTHLSNILRSKGYGIKIVSRMPGPQRLSWQELARDGLPERTTAVVNLAGQNVLDISRRWTAGFKQNVWNSRVNTTKTLAKAINDSKDPPKAFVVMTGVGIYEPSQNTEYTEESIVREHDFLSKLCIKWEGAARLKDDVSTRQIIIRSGVVLGRNGGMIKQIYLPFYMGVGGRLANGSQYLPWIHIDDITRLILFAIEHEEVSGIINGVAPQQITNQQFTNAFASALWRPAFFPVPETVLNILLSKDRAKMLTEGQRVVPANAQRLGYKYMYPDIQSACQELVSKK